MGRVQRRARGQRAADPHDGAQVETVAHEGLELLGPLTQLQPGPHGVATRLGRGDDRDPVVLQPGGGGLGHAAGKRDAGPLDLGVANQRAHRIQGLVGRIHRHQRQRGGGQALDPQPLLHPLGELALVLPGGDLELVGIQRADDPVLDRPQVTEELPVERVQAGLQAVAAPIGQEPGVQLHERLDRLQQRVLDHRQAQGHAHERDEVRIGAGRLQPRKRPPLTGQGFPVGLGPQELTGVQERAALLVGGQGIEQIVKAHQIAAHHLTGRPAPRQSPPGSSGRAATPCRSRSRSETASAAGADRSAPSSPARVRRSSGSPRTAARAAGQRCCGWRRRPGGHPANLASEVPWPFSMLRRRPRSFSQGQGR